MLLATTSISLTSAWRSATRIVKVNTSPTRTARILLAQLVMPLSPHTRVSSSQDVMISKLLVTSFCISLRASCLGRASLVAQRTRSITISRRRRLRLLSKSYAEATLASSESSWSIAALSSSNRNQITALVSTSSKVACRDINSMVASSTTPGSRIGSPRTKRPLKTVC